MIKKLRKPSSKHTNKIEKLLQKHNIPTSYMHINRRMVSRGVALGLFWAFIPMPMQMLAVILSMPLFRFNIPIAISMVWLSNPITMPFMYYVEYLTGNYILNLPGIEGTELSMDWFIENFQEILIPLYTGTAFFSITFSITMYYLINILWIRSIKSERNQRVKKDNLY